ncbi:hypothetical protein ACFY3M_53835 [Streptomyces mirabilis]|uniref:hypothetical protein n=1 Tax=Streptomyces mirabilis TaxID=68239 RepID=UPI00368995E5
MSSLGGHGLVVQLPIGRRAPFRLGGVWHRGIDGGRHRVTLGTAVDLPVLAPRAVPAGVEQRTVVAQFVAHAGLCPGATRHRFAIALVHQLTPSGIRTTATGLAANLRHSGTQHRTAAVGAVLAAAYRAGGWPAVVCGILVPRLLLTRSLPG